MDYKPLPIGTDDFRKLVTSGYYYVDKTIFVKELLDKKVEVNLFTRPRRFGKTLNLSMLRYFFEDTGDAQINAQNRKLFDGMEIMQEGERYTDEMTSYPVIQLSLKSAKQPTWELAYASLKEIIQNEFKRHMDIINGFVIEADRSRFLRLAGCAGSDADYVTALAFLSNCLESYYKKSVILLIDEYDVPLENAYFQGFYTQMVDFIRSLFESALKTNPSLNFAVITGCLRITKESIFTGLNNLEIISVLTKDYSQYFGFTPQDVEELLEYYQLSEKEDCIRQWYDGYLFGDTEIYNPWSIINYVKTLLADKEEPPRPYWSNTSSNNIIRSLIERSDLSVKAEIEDLIEGKSIEKPVHEDITYEDIYQSMDNLWNFLFFTGYLKKSGQRVIDHQIYIKLSIPNVEIRQIYKTKVMGWFQDKIEQKDMSGLYRSMLEGNAEEFQKSLTGILQDTISFYDNAEAFYHGFMLGILGKLKTYIVKSNREGGDGRFDILLRSLDISRPIIIMELKAAKKYKMLANEADDALAQIQKMGYDREFAEEGYEKSIRYGIAFYKKNCMIKKMEIEL